MKAALLALALALPLTLRAQSASVPPETEALRACAAFGARGLTDSAAVAGKAAESIFRRRISRNPRDVEALVGLGRALAQCLLPAADFMGQGALSQEAMETLENALDLAPTNWTARFILASIAYRSPAFLGRDVVAAKHFDELLRQQGNQAGDPAWARVYEYRGLQLMRAGKTDSARALWTRGITLFPGDTALAAVMKRSNASPPPASKPDSATTIATMRITARVEDTPAEPPRPAVQEVTRGKIMLTPGGAADVFTAVQFQPGATQVAEGTGVYTRGGDATETATILNGSRVLSLNRFEGLNGGMFGALEPWVVKSVRYSSGAFTARHGNALSGIIEIETDGKPRERRTRAGLSLVQASGTSWMPMGRKAGGWVSARVSHTGALLATHGRSDEFAGAPHSEEVIGSVIATPTPETEVRLTGLVATDGSRRIVNAAGWHGPFASDGDSRALMVASRWQAGQALVIRTSASGATRGTDFRFGILSRERDDRSIAARIDVEYEATDGVIVRSGIGQGAYSRSLSGAVPASPSVAEGAPVSVIDAERSAANDRGAYVETELTRGGWMLLSGVRVDRLPGETESTVDPRATLSHRRGNWTMRVGGGVFHQGRWRAESAIPDGGVPSGTPGEAVHSVASVEHESAGTTFRAEAYRKRYADYREYGSGPQVASSLARGVDLVAERQTGGRVNGWVGYSLLDASSVLVDGRKVRSPFDVTHTASASASVAVRDWSLGATGRYGTGAPTTPITGAISDANGFPLPVYGMPMSARLPEYARLDTRVMRYFRMPTMLLASFVEVINVTDRRNVSGVTWDAGYRNREYMHSFFSQRTFVVGAEAQFR